MSFLSFLDDFDGAIEVKFPIAAWDEVLNQADERVRLEEESRDSFVVKYLHIHEFEAAKDRFSNKVQYEVV